MLSLFIFIFVSLKTKHARTFCDDEINLFSLDLNTTLNAWNQLINEQSVPLVHVALVHGRVQFVHFVDHSVIRFEFFFWCRFIHWFMFITVVFFVFFLDIDCFQFTRMNIIHGFYHAHRIYRVRQKNSLFYPNEHLVRDSFNLNETISVNSTEKKNRNMAETVSRLNGNMFGTQNCSR